MISGMVSGAFAGAMNPSFCFVAGTAVLTTLGKKAIETIQVGDVIPCVDHIIGEAAEKKVISTTNSVLNLRHAVLISIVQYIWNFWTLQITLQFTKLGIIWGGQHSFKTIRMQLM